MAVYLSQDFTIATATPQGSVSGVSLTGSNAAQTITGAASTFDATNFASGRGVYIRGMPSGNGTYRITSLAGDGSSITLTPEGTPYSRSIPDFSSSSVELRTGAVSTDLDALLGSMQHSTQDNPCLVRILSDPVYGSCLEKFSPKLKTYGENNGWQYLGELSVLGASAVTTDIWIGYWVLFRPGESYGQLTQNISAGATTIDFDMVSGSISDFPRNNNQPYDATSVSWSSRECAMYVLLGDTDDASGFETIGYQSRTSTASNRITLASSAWRGLEGTTARDWSAGTRITIGYDFNHGFKMPGYEAASTPGRIGTRGIDYAQARLGYVAYDYDQAPDRLACPASYTYQYASSATFWWWGKTNIPSGYTGGQVYYKQNQWHAVEARLVMDTSAGVSDGQIHAWLDGTKVQEKTNVDWRGPGATFTKWNWLVWSSHYGDTAGDAPQKDERFLVTGFTIADAQINLYSSGTPPFAPTYPSIITFKGNAVTSGLAPGVIGVQESKWSFLGRSIHSYPYILKQGHVGVLSFIGKESDNSTSEVARWSAIASTTASWSVI